jgi:hypothetical protein
MRWIVFDDETAEAVVSKYKRGAAEIHEHDQPLDAALNAGSRSILILPSREPNSVLLATIESRIRPASKPRRDPVIGQFTPLRGVIRRTTVLTPPTPPQKTWWRRWTE